MEWKAATTYPLRPLRAARISNNQAAKILGFDDEYAEARDNDMVDLRRSIETGQDDVGVDAVLASIESLS